MPAVTSIASLKELESREATGVRVIGIPLLGGTLGTPDSEVDGPSFGSDSAALVWGGLNGPAHGFGRCCLDTLYVAVWCYWPALHFLEVCPSVTDNAFACAKRFLASVKVIFPFFIKLFLSLFQDRHDPEYATCSSQLEQRRAALQRSDSWSLKAHLAQFGGRCSSGSRGEISDT